LASSTTKDVFEWNGERFAPVSIPYVLNAIGYVTCLSEDHQGRLYAAHSRELSRLEKGEWQRLVSETQLGPSSLARFSLDAEDNLWFNLWPKGLARWSEATGFQTLRAGIPEIVYAALDGAGGLWLNTAVNGVARVDLASLKSAFTHADAPLRVDWFNEEDGLGTRLGSGYFNGLFVGKDGRVWVATTKGVGVIDYAQWQAHRQRSLPPRVRIEQVLVDGRAAASPALNSLKDESRRSFSVPIGARRLEFQYAAINLTQPERTRYKYRLVGYDQDWIEAGPTRSAHYGTLPSGRYQFQVMAGSSGQWNLVTAILPLEVSRAWWDNRWWPVAVVFVLVAMLGLAGVQSIRFMRRNRPAEFSRYLLDHQEEDRKRIAAQLHDSLSQSLLVAKNMALMGVRTNIGKEETSTQFSAISNAVSDALHKTRDITQDLYPLDLDRFGLTKSIRALAERVQDSSNAQCRLALDDVDEALPEAKAINLYRLVEESFNHALKRSQATRIDLQLKRQGDHLFYQISDNGLGLNVEKTPAANSVGTGLNGLEELARLLGGQLEVTRQPEQGVTVQIRIPI
jgi:signal transduction histidine kinase